MKFVIIDKKVISAEMTFLLLYYSVKGSSVGFICASNIRPLM